MKWNNNIRIGLAIFQATLLCLIMASGMLFMHKHKTSSGKIVIHVHPYNLKTDSDGSKHHHSDQEIHFLDVVFQGNFLITDFTAVDQPYAAPYFVVQVEQNRLLVNVDKIQYSYLRGPPTPLS